MTTVPLPPCDGPRLQADLYEKYHIEVPVMEWQGRPYLRVSIGAYNTRQDIERLTGALRALLRS
jgi:selenocysteine lyase/cysteine desulfurase